MANAGLLRVKNLHKHFGGIHAVRDVNLSLDDNCIHALIGPNGAGKTTLLEQLAGTLRPDRGEIFFAPQNVRTAINITRLPTHRRAKLGLVRSFQQSRIIAPMTLLENVMLAVQSTSGHSFRFWAKAATAQMRERAMHHLSGVGLAARASQVAGNAAHGEQRRLELAMALALQPRVLLLDEPFAGIGAVESAAMIELLDSLRAQCAVLLIEHDMQAVFALADVVSVLVGGRVIASGDAATIRADKKVQRAYLGEG